jgi:hypothetical protein
MFKSMSLESRRELLINVRELYKKGNWLEKGKILDGFIAASGYDRKYAIRLMNGENIAKNAAPKRQSMVKYDEQVKQALLTLWYAANQICSKRLVPFIPELMAVMERHGHMRLHDDVRDRLLSISHSTVDRLLKSEKVRIGKPISTTRPGSLFKHQIQVRTFADWDDVTPGFFEVDLVAHCGGNTSGAFLNTLVLIDIATGWLECLPLLRKSANDVIIGLNLAQELMPFPLVGLDTDNGSEFINKDLLDYCETNRITFTRSRAYKKNDQAHVEEKNGSVVRRVIGYDRYEGRKAWEALSELYRVLRVYVNFFQPSLKRLSKERCGAKVKKKYDVAKTPYQRVLISGTVESSVKETLKVQYQGLDPVALLERLELLQNRLFDYAWLADNNQPGTVASLSDIVGHIESIDVDNSSGSTKECFDSTAKLQHYRQTKKSEINKKPRTYRTRKDIFEKIWDEIQLKLELNPERTAKALLDDLIVKYPTEFKPGHLRTLQRRVCQWRKEQLNQEELLRVIMQPNKPLFSQNTVG